MKDKAQTHVDHYGNGLGKFRDNNHMENLMGFLVVYTRKVRNDRYFVNLLIK